MVRPLILKINSALRLFCYPIFLAACVTACVNGHSEKDNVDHCSTEFIDQIDIKNTDFVSKAYSDYKNLEEIELFKSATKNLKLIVINRIGEASKSISKALICENKIMIVRHELHVNSKPYSETVSEQTTQSSEEKKVYGMEYTFENDKVVAQHSTEKSSPNEFDEDLTEILYSRFIELKKQNTDFLKSE